MYSSSEPSASAGAVSPTPAPDAAPVPTPADEKTSAVGEAARERGRVDNVIIRAYALKYYRQVSRLLNVLPSDMILLFKTNDCLRHIDSLLFSPINTMTGKQRAAQSAFVEW